MTNEPVIFKLLKGWHLRQYDTRNWVIARNKEFESGRVDEMDSMYFGSLSSAWKHVVEDGMLTAKTKKELGDIIEKLEKLKEPFFTKN